LAQIPLPRLCDRGSPVRQKRRVLEVHGRNVRASSDRRHHGRGRRRGGASANPGGAGCASPVNNGVAGWHGRAGPRAATAIPGAAVPGAAIAAAAVTAATRAAAALCWAVTLVPAVTRIAPSILESIVFQPALAHAVTALTLAHAVTALTAAGAPAAVAVSVAAPLVAATAIVTVAAIATPGISTARAAEASCGTVAASATAATAAARAAVPASNRGGGCIAALPCSGRVSKPSRFPVLSPTTEPSESGLLSLRLG
jgi:hypothetical protein